LKEYITDPKVVEEILSAASVCRVGFCLDDVPYVVPMNFAFSDPFVYIHTGTAGRKLDIIAKNENVCFEVDIDHELKMSQSPCACGMRYRSVIGFGKASVVEERRETVEALDALVERYGGPASSEYPDEVLEKTVVIRIKLDSLTARVKA